MSSESSLVFLQPYLACTLQERGFDSEIYSTHLLTMLAEDLLQPSLALEDFLNDCSFNEVDLLFLAHKWREIAKRGSLSEGELDYIREFEESQNPSVPSSSLTSSSSRTTSDHNTLPGQDTHYHYSGEGWDGEEPEATDDLDMYYSEVDWLGVIEGVEEILRSTYQWTQAEFSPEALFYALAMSGNHVEYAAQLLINGAQVLESCKPCRHLIKSKCLRKDCYYDHQLADFPCRYWLFSQCANASANDDPSTLEGRTVCPFMHGLPVVDWQEPTSSQTKPVDASEDLADAFPALSDQSKSKSTQQSRGYLAAVKSATSSSTVFSLTESSAKTSTASGSSGGNKHASRDIGFADILRSHKFVANDNRDETSKFSRNGIVVGDWVESGDVVRQDYETLRREAREFAIGRNKFLQEATLAYMHGNRSSAKSLSRQGQMMNDKMKDYHIMVSD